MRLARPVAALASVAAAAALLGACGASDSTQDCATVAQEVGGQVHALRASIGTASRDPRDAATALRKIPQDLDDITGQTNSNPAATKAVGDLSLAVANVKDELDKSEPADIRPVASAAGALSAACPKKG